MGRDWDKALPSIEIWKECLRVLKAGAFAFIMSSPRQDVQYRMIENLERAGFIIGFSPIYWCYASGFPKSMNISKAVDKRLGHERKVIGHVNPYRDGSKRSKRGRLNEAIFEGGYKTIELEEGLQEVTAPVSKEAKKLDGLYSPSLKPAVEVILVAMKPLSEKTYIDQALANGKGGLWLDDCRIPLAKNDVNLRPNALDHETTTVGGYEAFTGVQGKYESRTEYMTDMGYHNSKGRFPANLIVSDDALNDGKITRSRAGEANHSKSKTISEIYHINKQGKGIKSGAHFDDKGSFSRYFDLDNWWINKINDLPKEVQKTFPFLIVAKPSKSEKNKGLNNLPKKKRKKPQPTANTHPTVKSITLMSYLVTLGSRKKDIILDPFVGSGTTAIACKMLRRRYIGIDISREYLLIASKRLQAVERSYSLAGLI